MKVPYSKVLLLALAMTLVYVTSTHAQDPLVVKVEPPAPSIVDYLPTASFVTLLGTILGVLTALTVFFKKAGLRWTLNLSIFGKVWTRNEQPHGGDHEKSDNAPTGSSRRREKT